MEEGQSSAQSMRGRGWVKFEEEGSSDQGDQGPGNSSNEESPGSLEVSWQIIEITRVTTTSQEPGRTWQMKVRTWKMRTFAWSWGRGGGVDQVRGNDSPGGSNRPYTGQCCHHRKGVRVAKKSESLQILAKVLDAALGDVGNNILRVATSDVVVNISWVMAASPRHQPA